MTEERMYEEYEKYDDHMMHDFDGQSNGWMENGKMLTCQTAVNTKKGTMDDIEVGMKTSDQTDVGTMKVMKLMTFLKNIL